jgi:hypothetical protein
VSAGNLGTAKFPLASVVAPMFGAGGSVCEGFLPDLR